MNECMFGALRVVVTRLMGKCPRIVILYIYIFRELNQRKQAQNEITKESVRANAKCKERSREEENKKLRGSAVSYICREFVVSKSC